MSNKESNQENNNKKVHKVKNKRDINMLEYTYRDLGQEYLMKRKAVRAVATSIITIIALIVFIALYVEETREVQRTYQKQFEIGLKTVCDDIDSYRNAEGDLEFRYRRLVADMNTTASFLFLMKKHEEQKKVIQTLYTVVLRYPEQSRSRLDEIYDALTDLRNGLDKGYDEIKTFTDSIDRKGQ